MKHLKQLTYLLLSLVLLGCNITKTASAPTNVIGKDFTEKKELMKEHIYATVEYMFDKPV